MRPQRSDLQKVYCFLPSLLTVLPKLRYGEDPTVEPETIWEETGQVQWLGWGRNPAIGWTDFQDETGKADFNTTTRKRGRAPPIITSPSPSLLETFVSPVPLQFFPRPPVISELLGIPCHLPQATARLGAGFSSCWRGRTYPTSFTQSVELSNVRPVIQTEFQPTDAVSRLRFREASSFSESGKQANAVPTSSPFFPSSPVSSDKVPVWRSTNPDPPILQHRHSSNRWNEDHLWSDSRIQRLKRSREASRCEIGKAGLCDATTKKEGIIDKGFEIGLICENFKFIRRAWGIRGSLIIDVDTAFNFMTP